MPSERRSSRSVDRQSGNRATIQGVISTEHRAETDRRAVWGAIGCEFGGLVGTAETDGILPASQAAQLHPEAGQ
jgi:hypothetical protein